MKLFECIVDDGKDAFKTVVAAKNKKELLSVYGGNGEFVKTTDVTKDYPIDINKLEDILRNANYGKAEINLITELVREHNELITK